MVGNYALAIMFLAPKGESLLNAHRLYSVAGGEQLQAE